MPFSLTSLPSLHFIQSAIHGLHTEAVITVAAAHPQAFDTGDSLVRTQFLLGLSSASEPYSAREAVTTFLRATCASLPEGRIPTAIQEEVRRADGLVDDPLFASAYEYLVGLSAGFDAQRHAAEIVAWRALLAGASTRVHDFAQPARTPEALERVIGRAERLIPREGGSIFEAGFEVDHLEHMRRLFFAKEGRFVQRVRLFGPTYHELAECLRMPGLVNVTHLQVTNPMDDPFIIAKKVAMLAEAAPYLPRLRFLDVSRCLFSDEQKTSIMDAFRRCRLDANNG